MSPPPWAFLFKMVLSIPGPLYFQMSFRFSLFISVRRKKRGQLGVPWWPRSWGSGIVTAVACVLSLARELPLAAAAAKTQTNSSDFDGVEMSLWVSVSIAISAGWSSSP